MSIRTAIANSVVASPLVHFRLRTLLLKLLGFNVPLRCQIRPGVTITSTQLTLGRRSTIHTSTVVDCRAPITIGDNVGIGIGVRLITSSHEYDAPDVRAGRTTWSPISIGDGAWIGASATILGGVNIGTGAVIAAGSVVTRDCEPHTLYAGVPVRAVRQLPT